MKKRRQPLAEHRPDLKGEFVYFARGAVTKLIKIGKSTNPTNRAVNMQVGSGEDLDIILTLPGTRRDERKFHIQFRGQRERGEWFREEGRLHAFLKERDLHFIDEPEPPISVAEIPALELLKGSVRGFCTTKEAKQKLLDFGISKGRIYLLGEGHENIKRCLDSFRSPGWLVLAQDLRAFGKTKKAITAQTNEIERKHIRIYDITHPTDGTYTALIARAHGALAGSRFADDPRRAHRLGRKGGEAKAVEQALKRNAVLREDIVRRLAAVPELSWKRKAAILGKPWTASTLFRHYGKD